MGSLEEYGEHNLEEPNQDDVEPDWRECPGDKDQDIWYSLASDSDIGPDKFFEGSEAEFHLEIKERREIYKRHTLQLRKQSKKSWKYNYQGNGRDRTEQRTILSNTLTGTDYDLSSSDHMRRFRIPRHMDVLEQVDFPFRNPTVIRARQTKLPARPISINHRLK
ncbi:hypothetical protein E2P81_ATG03590 [Venturia nashicola]|uniref:Uncharacterized protein n=1 Tax=Venturia nashicola TaxID=86259 RepID=A0A4Z1PRW3_9PEZI|nr:hypothetical protein E6O75_ATG03665 [Venturia nashicola]TLD37915.1 hypothetical protein E2P81_ATG03590 [Venturia nashicola]